jgi:hypothetical protein
MTYELGGLTGAIIFLLLLSQLIHWIVRKSRRKPKKTFREWLTTWIAGPALFLFGDLCAGMYEDSPHAQLSFLLGVVLI